MKLLCLTLLALSITNVFCKDAINSGIVNAEVSRKIDISSHLVKVSETIKIENKGSSSVSSYLLAIPSSENDKLSFLSAAVSSNYYTINNCL